MNLNITNIGIEEQKVMDIHEMVTISISRLVHTFVSGTAMQRPPGAKNAIRVTRLSRIDEIPLVSSGQGYQ